MFFFLLCFGHVAVSIDMCIFIIGHLHLGLSNQLALHLLHADLAYLSTAAVLFCQVMWPSSPVLHIQHCWIRGDGGERRNLILTLQHLLSAMSAVASLAGSSITLFLSYSAVTLRSAWIGLFLYTWISTKERVVLSLLCCTGLVRFFSC